MKPIGMWPHARLSSKLQRLFALLLVKWKWFYVSAFGRGNIPSKGGVIVISNHPSYGDPPIHLMAITRTATAVAMHELWRGPVAPYMMFQGHIAIKRGNAKSAARTRRKMIRTVRAGGLVLIFPEGKRSPASGEILPFKSGAFDVAWETGTPVVPSGIAGSNKLWPHDKRFWDRKQPVVIVYGEAVDPRNYSAIEEFTAACRTSMVNLVAEAEQMLASK